MVPDIWTTNEIALVGLSAKLLFELSQKCNNSYQHSYNFHVRTIPGL